MYEESRMDYAGFYTRENGLDARSCARRSVKIVERTFIVDAFEPQT